MGSTEQGYLSAELCAPQLTSREQARLLPRTTLGVWQRLDMQEIRGLHLEEGGSIHIPSPFSCLPPQGHPCSSRGDAGMGVWG